MEHCGADLSQLPLFHQHTHPLTFQSKSDAITNKFHQITHLLCDISTDINIAWPQHSPDLVGQPKRAVNNIVWPQHGLDPTTTLSILFSRNDHTIHSQPVDCHLPLASIYTYIQRNFDPGGYTATTIVQQIPT